MKKRVLAALISTCVIAGITHHSMDGISVNAAQGIYGNVDASQEIYGNVDASQGIYGNGDAVQEEADAAVEKIQNDIGLLAEKSESQEEDWDWVENADGSISIAEYFGSGIEIEVPSALGGREVTAIGQGVFQNNENIVRVTIPDTVKMIDADTFSWCRSLQSVFLPEGLEIIGNNAFCMCVSLQKVSLPDSLKKIGEGAFSSCFGLEEIKIPAQIEKIEKWAFSNCTALNYAALPEDLLSIGEGAFEKSGMRSIQIPEKVSNIGIRAFSSCDRLEKIEVAPENTAFLSEDGILFNKKKTELIAYPEGKAQESYAVPSGVQKIGAYAFAYQNNNALSKVTLPESIQEIGAYAFYYAYFDNINFSGRLKAIGEFAFAYNAFKEVAIPANTEKIGEGAFVYAPDLSSIEVDVSNAYFASEGGLLLNKEKTALLAYPGGKKDKEYVIPAGITEIGPYAFATFSASPYPEKIFIPKYVKKIKRDAFSGIHMQDISVLNPECDIEWAMDEEGNKTEAISSRATIHGYENSTAQEYAQKNGNPFAVLSDGECQHDYMEKITVSATCSKKGAKTFTCRKCGDSYTEEVPVIGHDYQTVTVKATTGKDGSVQKKCKLCGDVPEVVLIAYPKTITLSKPSVTYNGKAQKVSVKVKDSAGGLLLLRTILYLTAAIKMLARPR